MPSPTQSLRQSVLVHAPAKEVYEALVHGKNLGLRRSRRIVQSFRYSLPEWPLEHFSKVTIQLRPVSTPEVPVATRVILDQSAIPNGCVEAVEEHWRDHVWPGLKSILDNRVRETRLPRFSLRRKVVH
jgi:hypothetical protein